MEAPPSTIWLTIVVVVAAPGVKARRSDAIPIAFEGGRIMLSDLVDAVDMDKERARLAKVIEQKAKQVEGLTRRLDNPNYVQKAKPELVQETRQLLEEAGKDLAAAEAALAGLG